MDKLRPIVEESYKELEPQFKHLTIWIALQFVAAQVLESFVLFDRFLYLEEQEVQKTLQFIMKTRMFCINLLQGISACIVPLFDPVISPRNCAIVGLKNSSLDLLSEVIL